MSIEDNDQVQEEPTNDEQALDLGPALEPVEQRVVPYMGEEALAVNFGNKLVISLQLLC